MKTGVIDVIHQICTNKQLMGRTCILAKRQQVDQMCDRVVPMRPQMSLGVIQKDVGRDDLEEAIGPNRSHFAKDGQLLDNKQRGVPPTGVK